ncbi:hypothetical protein HR060_12790 [Catenovulum sp. SM1970]|uniref:hypothetical protein n=1 Tax=Marinifaba aquimaris TaxID=2741323 RepID=UPI0015720FD9|nr:hypothetical protein [Marinifaba aquimaris]NTS77738.1 hypothetical protein [Marinifaba aquimaris]
MLTTPVGVEEEWLIEGTPYQDLQHVDGTTQTGFKLQAINGSDDIKMFIKGQVSNLKPNTWYQVNYDLELASNIAEFGCSGIGGSPSSLYVKFSASTNEPLSNIDNLNGSQDYYYMNLDMGQQNNRGQDAILLGDIGISELESCDSGSEIYATKSFNSTDNNFYVQTDYMGNAWVSFGTDSGYEGFSRVYFTNTTLTFEEVEPQSQYAVSYDFSDKNTYFSTISFDHPDDVESDWQIYSQANSPYLLTTQEWRNGLTLSFINHSDDTGMLAMTQLLGLKSNTTYNSNFDLSFATNIGKECFGIGGAPNAVTVKAGLSRSKPSKSLDDLNHYRLNIDMGNQASEGPDAINLGKIGSDEFDFCDPSHHEFALVNQQASNFEFTTDETGQAWFYFAFDSGFEGLTQVIIDSASIDLEEK